MKNKLVHLSLLFILFTLGFSNTSFGQGSQTSDGVDVDGKWYLGEGLKKGDYFEYSLCEMSLNACTPINFKMWIKGEKQNFSETLWDAKILVSDGNKIIKGSMGLGKIAPEPILFDDDISDYSVAFKTSLAWLSAYATGNEGDRIHGPQEFRNGVWGTLGPIGGGSDAQLITNRVETIESPFGVVESVVIGWYSGNDNEIWLVDNFPFPIKALTYAGITENNAPIMYQFDLLDYKENVTDDPFKDVDEIMPREELLKCPTEFFDYKSGRISTDSHSMMIQYNYSPEIPIEGCNIDWKINFMSKYNDVEILDQIHYDIWVVDEQGNKLRSYAQDIGEDKLFNEFGRVHHLIPINEQAGIVRYAIFVYGTGPEQEEPDVEMGGFVVLDIEIEENPLLEKLNTDAPISPPNPIPDNDVGPTTDESSPLPIEEGKLVSPKKQLEQGIEPEAVTCKEGLVLMIKHYGTPACVRPNTAENLEERGWGGMAPPCCKPTVVSSATNFEECANVGNPVMESYPRKCRTIDGKQFVESIPENKACEMLGGLWGIWSNAADSGKQCNPPTPDQGVECTDSSQCKSYCQAKEGSEIDSNDTGECYGYEFALCMQEVSNGTVQPEWCQ